MADHSEPRSRAPTMTTPETDLLDDAYLNQLRHDLRECGPDAFEAAKAVMADESSRRCPGLDDFLFDQFLTTIRPRLIGLRPQERLAFIFKYFVDPLFCRPYWQERDGTLTQEMFAPPIITSAQTRRSIHREAQNERTNDITRQDDTILEEVEDQQPAKKDVKKALGGNLTEAVICDSVAVSSSRRAVYDRELPALPGDNSGDSLVLTPTESEDSRDLEVDESCPVSCDPKRRRSDEPLFFYAHDSIVDTSPPLRRNYSIPRSERMIFHPLPPTPTVSNRSNSSPLTPASSQRARVRPSSLIVLGQERDKADQTRSLFRKIMHHTKPVHRQYSAEDVHENSRINCPKLPRDRTSPLKKAVRHLRHTTIDLKQAIEATFASPMSRAHAYHSPGKVNRRYASKEGGNSAYKDVNKKSGKNSGRSRVLTERDEA